MPKRLSDITHQYERTAADLEQAQDELTVATEHYRAKVEAASHAHRAVATELLDYLRRHPNEVVVSNDLGYHYGERGEIVKRSVHWSHHIWVEEPEPEPRYQVPTDNGTMSPIERVNALSAAWALGSEDAEESAS